MAENPPSLESIDRLGEQIEWIHYFIEELQKYLMYFQDMPTAKALMPSIVYEKRWCVDNKARLKHLKEIHPDKKHVEHVVLEYESIYQWILDEFDLADEESKPPINLFKKTDECLSTLQAFRPSLKQLYNELIKKRSSFSDERCRIFACFVTDVEESFKKTGKVGGDSMMSSLLREASRIILETVDAYGCAKRETKSGYEEHEGVFDDPATCIRALVAAQKKLHTWNEVLSGTEKICVRIGVHVGKIPFLPGKRFDYREGFVEAARINSVAQGGQILASEGTINSIDQKTIELLKKEDISFQRLDAPVRTKDMEVIVYEVRWKLDQKGQPSAGYRGDEEMA